MDMDSTLINIECVDEIADAADTVVWMRDQPWFTGSFATMGLSYLGFTQWALLADPPPELKAAIITVGPHDFAESTWGTGAFTLDNFLSWSDMMAHQESGPRAVIAVRQQLAKRALARATELLGPAAMPLVLDLLDAKQCASLLSRVLAIAGQLDVFHANAGLYVGGNLVDADPEAIDRMLNLNVNVVMKNVHNVLPHMIERGVGDIIVTSSLAAHFPTPWEPVYASSKWAIHCFVQTVRRQVFKHGIRVGSISPGPVITSLLADWPAEKLAEAKASGSLVEASEVAEVVLFMLTRPRGMTIRDVVMMPTQFDL